MIYILLVNGKSGETNVIKQIIGQDKTKLFLHNLGFVEGSEVCIINKMAGSLIVNVKDARIAINQEMAKMIII